jgi:hypothetical protein
MKTKTEYFITTGEGRTLKYLGFARGVKSKTLPRQAGDTLTWRGGAGNAVIVSGKSAERLAAKHLGQLRPVAK